MTDYFVIGTGFNPRQLQSIADESIEKLKALGASVLGMEGRASARWILVDFGDVVLHLFDRDARKFYDLELLWGDAPKVPWAAGPAPRPPVARG